MALSTAVCTAVMIKSEYLPRSLVDRCPETSADPSASSSVDSNEYFSVSLVKFVLGVVSKYIPIWRGINSNFYG